MTSPSDTRSKGATKRSASIRERLIRSSMMRSMRRDSSRMVRPKLDRSLGGEVVFLGQSFGIAADGRERSAQLVARVGNEIDAHLLGGDEHRHVSNIRTRTRVLCRSSRIESRHGRPGSAMPVTSRSPRRLREDLLERLRMADRETHIAALDPVPSSVRAGALASAHGAVFDDERGLVERIDRVRERLGYGPAMRAGQ